MTVRIDPRKGPRAEIDGSTLYQVTQSILYQSWPRGPSEARRRQGPRPRERASTCAPRRAEARARWARRAGWPMPPSPQRGATERWPRARFRAPPRESTRSRAPRARRRAPGRPPAARRRRRWAARRAKRRRETRWRSATTRVGCGRAPSGDRPARRSDRAPASPVVPSPVGVRGDHPPRRPIGRRQGDRPCRARCARRPRSPPSPRRAARRAARRPRARRARWWRRETCGGSLSPRTRAWPRAARRPRPPRRRRAARSRRRTASATGRPFRAKTADRRTARAAERGRGSSRVA